MKNSRAPSESFAARYVVVLVAIFCPFMGAAARLRNATAFGKSDVAPASALVFRGVFCADVAPTSDLGKAPQVGDAKSYEECRDRCMKDMSCLSFGVCPTKEQSCVKFSANCIGTPAFRGHVQNVFGGSSAEKMIMELETRVMMEDKGNGYDGYKYDRCTSLKAPMPQTKYTGSEKMTLKVCHDFCLTHKSFYFMVKDGTQCFCSDKYEMLIGIPETCDVPCAGNGTETCGGKKGVSVYTA